jgi:hypothetical protein
MILILLILSILLLIVLPTETQEPFASEYPCRVSLSDREFLTHMIPHHQLAIDMSVEHMKHTKNDILFRILRDLIRIQTYEITLMRTYFDTNVANVSKVDTHQRFLPTTVSSIYPNTLGLTNTYCDPGFFHTAHHMSHGAIATDKMYIEHMIPHHQVAVDMCKMLLQHTKSDFLIQLAYGMIRTQESEIVLLHDLLKSRFIDSSTP